MNNKKVDKATRFFICMCLFNIGGALGFTATWVFEEFTQPLYIALHKTGSTIDFICGALIWLAYEGFLFECFYVRADFRKALWRGSVGLCIVHIIFSVLSNWNGMYFYIGADNLYRRGDWWMLSFSIYNILFILNNVLIVISRKQIPKRDFYFFLGGSLIIIILGFIQLLFYGVSLLRTSYAIAILFIFINIQSRREIRMEKQERELVESRISIMLSQIQPHFLYNTLAAIRHLCKIDPKAAEETVVEFSNYLRGNMDLLLLKESVPFEKELRHVETYLNIEKKRHGNKLNVSNNIKVKDFMIPALTLQPIVENAVKHGITKKEHGGTIKIKTEETDKAFIITVNDDGVGFDVNNKLDDDGHSHIGIENTRSRLAAMCNGTLEIKSKPGTGTTAVITIPKGII